jgi:hypothetical protein
MNLLVHVTHLGPASQFSGIEKDIIGFTVHDPASPGTSLAVSVNLALAFVWLGDTPFDRYSFTA